MHVIGNNKHKKCLNSVDELWELEWLYVELVQVIPGQFYVSLNKDFANLIWQIFTPV